MKKFTKVIMWTGGILAISEFLTICGEGMAFGTLRAIGYEDVDDLFEEIDKNQLNQKGYAKIKWPLIKYLTDVVEDLNRNGFYTL